MSNEKPVELTEAEIRSLEEPLANWAVSQVWLDDTDPLCIGVTRIVKAREAAARREALLETRGEVQRRMDGAELADGGKLQTWDALAGVMEWIEEQA